MRPGMSVSNRMAAGGLMFASLVGSAVPAMNTAVYTRLRGVIVTGRIAPGTRIVETEFARRLNVSRTPVREAMRRLAQEGLANVVGTAIGDYRDAGQG
jgi:hypothetical protein